MKTLLAMTVILGLVGLTAAQPPLRHCTTQPAQSSYKVYVPPAHHTDSQGSYVCKDGVCRQINLADRVRIISVAQINPAYTSYYSPDGYDGQTQTDILNELRRQGQVQAQLLAQYALLSQAKATPGVPATVPGTPPVVIPAGPPNTAIGLAVMVAKCAACHQTGKLLPEQRFTLLDARGNLVTLTPTQKLKVIQKVRTAQMPPPLNTQQIPPVTDAEFAAICDLIGT